MGVLLPQPPAAGDVADDVAVGVVVVALALPFAPPPAT
jgi:hypothetical protein